MSDKKEGHSNSSFWQLMIVIPGAILAFTVLISVLAYLFGSGTQTPATTEVVTAAEKQVEENIEPVAEVEVAAEDAGATTVKSGEEVVKTVCALCHEAGLMNAPKIGDKDQWGPRIAQGYDTLVSHAVNGFNTMPAKGGNPALSEEEVAAAVKLMANNSGANF